MNIQDVIAVLDQKGIKYCPLFEPIDQTNQVVVWDTADILDAPDIEGGPWTYFVRGRFVAGTPNKEFWFCNAYQFGLLLDLHHVRKGL